MITNVVAGNVPSVQTLALTANVDSFALNGNSVINGAAGTTPSTFTSGDKIVATGVKQYVEYC